MSLHRVSSRSWAPRSSLPESKRSRAVVIVSRCRRGQTHGYLVAQETPADDYIRFENYQAFGPIPKDHLTEDADSQGESFETTRGLDSDPETEVDLRAAMSLVVPVMGQQFVVPSRHISSRKEKLWKLSENLLARQSSEKVRKKMRTNGWRALKNIQPTTDGVILGKEIILKSILMTPPGAGSIVQGSRTSGW
ncbi:hypothetical protein OUZ56_030074 [Daphnia magna]|uniref:Uncharacterized protein n=1 Tax=Daphnia magna TaxID=35525 RepID=A0ABQ9ZRH6_9CRUS|nr:hypothetical protein OUZ56_030074 [Daphnia magna]